MTKIWREKCFKDLTMYPESCGCTYYIKQHNETTYKPKRQPNVLYNVNDGYV